MPFILNRQSAQALYTAFKANFQNGFSGVSPLWQQIATRVPSTTSKEMYAWLKDLPGLREWLGDRQVVQLAQEGYELTNRKFEQTVAVKIDDLEDDTYGTYKPLFEMMGHSAASLPDELVFDLLLKGFTEKCFDGEAFFSANHPVGNTGKVKRVSNIQSGSKAPWVLLDTTRPLKPFIYQERKAPEFVAMDEVSDETRFMQGAVRYGTDARAAAGFGFWQMAFGSQKDLSTENFNSAYAALAAMRGDGDRPLGIKPTVLLVGTTNRAAANEVVAVQTLASGASNPNYQAVEVIVTPWLD